MKSQKQGVEWWLPGVGEWKEWEDDDHWLQTFCYNVNKFQGSKLQHGDLELIILYCILEHG